MIGDAVDAGAQRLDPFEVLGTISPTGEVAPALNINQVFSGDEDQPSDADFTIAPDWSKIVYYVDMADASGDDQDDKWSSTTYCLRGHKYEQCGEEKKAKRPDPPNFKLQSVSSCTRHAEGRYPRA